MKETKKVLSVRIELPYIQQIKTLANNANIAPSAMAERMLITACNLPEYGTTEEMRKAFASAVIHNPRAIDVVQLNGPKGNEGYLKAAIKQIKEGEEPVTARSLFEHYQREEAIPDNFAIAHKAGVIPLSWFTARYGYPDASHIDAFDEFISIDVPADYGLDEPAWEFVEE